MSLFSRKDVACWATPRQLRKAGLFADEGLMLGRAHRRLVRHNGDEHTLIVASTGEGKTTCFAYPNLLSWRESVLIHDPKEEMFEKTAPWRRTFSRVVQLSPARPGSGHYNVLDAIRLRTDYEMRDTQLLAEALTDPSMRGADKRLGSDAHFTEMARTIAGALVLYGLHTQRARSLGALDSLLFGEGRFDEVLAALARYPHAGMRRGAFALAKAGERNERGAIITTLTRALEVFSDPLVQRATDTSDFTLRDLRERAQPMSLYITVPFSDQERLRPWLRLVLRQIVDYNVRTQHGRTWKLLGLIDEFPSLHRLSLLEDGLKYLRGYGMRMVLITPSMKDIIATYGRDHTFFESTKYQVAFGIWDKDVAEAFSGRVGMTEVVKTRSMGGGKASREKIKEPLLSATALMGLPARQALVLAGRHKIVVRKVHYQEKGWQ